VQLELDRGSLWRSRSRETFYRFDGDEKRYSRRNRGAAVVSAAQLRPGMAIRYEGQIYKVLASDYHAGQGRMGGASHVSLRNLSTGALWEHSFRAELKLEEVPIEKRPLTFLYSDQERSYFMNPISFEQVEIANTVIGQQIRLLESDMQVSVEFLEDRPVNVVFPDVIEVRIAETAPPVHGQQDNTWKTARLDNGITVMVPQFVKNGDLIRLDVATLKYIDRARARQR
jgi:elongation factor P